MRILIVEDETKLALALKRALELQKYAVDLAYDGINGHDLASTESYDLIILDIMLPGMVGTEICSALRRENIQTPILMLTAKGQVSDKTTGLDAGADDYMVKPFSLEELFSRIRALIRRANKNNDSILTVRDLTLDPASLKVKRADKEISLSTKEFAVLEYLMRNKNKVLTKSQIVSNVWNYDADVLLATVEVHIKNLRDKVDKPFKEQLIKTIRGFGYEIREEK
jgi:DNA-binding response OmpR family regulator